MRLKIDNRTREDVSPFIHLAARTISAVPGKVTVIVYYSRRYYRGRSWFNQRFVKIWIPPRDNFMPSNHEKFGVAEQAHTYEELITGLAAHELAHQMRRGSRNRHSVRERFCREKWNEAVELLRSEPGQQFVRDFHKPAIERMKIRTSKRAEREAYQHSSAAKLAKLEQLEKRWRTKLKRATTALKKIERKKKRLLSVISSEVVEASQTQPRE